MRKLFYTLIILLGFQEIHTQELDLQHFGELFVKSINDPVVAKEKKYGDILFVPGLAGKSEQIFQSLHESYAPMKYHHAELIHFKRSTGDVYVLHIYGQKAGIAMYTDFQLYSENNPYKIKQIAFVAEVSEPISLPNGDIGQDITLNWLDGYIKKLQEEYDLYGSVVLARGDKIFFNKQFGYCDQEKSRLINADTKFGIASGGKMFTAIGIMQLVELGKIKLDDPITRYIKGFTDERKAEKITVHHILSHTSGIGEYWSGQYVKKVSEANDINGHLQVVLEQGFDFDAGNEYRYCNSNFILGGAIIEKVSGMDYYTFVKKNIFEPLEMSDTGYPAFVDSDVASGLKRAENGKDWVSTASAIHRRGSSAGGAVTTAEDMLKFARALARNKLLSEMNFKRMIVPQNKPHDEIEKYGYGFILNKYSGEMTYGHGGTANGYNFEFRYFPKQDITFIIFNNQNNGAYDDLKRNILKLISGER